MTKSGMNERIIHISECDQLCQIMAEYADAPQRAKPLCFFDGSLNISFAVQLKPGLARLSLYEVEYMHQ